VDYWQGDNGGATSPGVTRDQITVVLPYDQGATLSRPVQDMENYLNSRFELYGRKIRFKSFAPTADDRDGGPGLLADADTAASYKPFASLEIENGREPYIYYDSLARRKIISIDSNPQLSSDSHRASMAPYEWSFLPGEETMGQSIGEYVCAQLARKAPKWAGPDFATTTNRTFGVVESSNPDGSKANTAPLKAALARCGQKVVAEEVVPDAFPPPAPETANAILDLKRKGISTVIVYAHAYAMTYVKAEATNQSYTPEWMQSSFGFGDEDLSGAEQSGAQQAHTFGLSFWNKLVPTDQLVWTQAIREVDPTFTWQKDLDAQQVFKPEYEAMLLLASGLQMAGPRLTPEAFQNGLFKTRFPNAGAGGPPYYQSRVSFGPGDFNMQGDASLIWWSPADQSYQKTQGTFCYADLGVRRAIGGWPKGNSHLFADAGACR
jgi:hypothetical protein